MTYLPTAAALHHTLYQPRFEHEACGIGLIADIPGRRSHEFVQMAVEALANLEHRGGVAADAGTGDGAGLLTQIPISFFGRELGLDQVKYGDLAAGMFFADRDLAPETWQDLVSRELRVVGLQALAWRQIPIGLDALGRLAAASLPAIWQAFIRRPDFLDRGDPFEKVLYLARRAIEAEAAAEDIRLYIPSLSSRTIVYKGLMLGSQLARFYPDLADPHFASAITLFHQRYATNTFPTWERAQPFRILAHNGEINTIEGNVNWLSARERSLADSAWGQAIRPIIDTRGSDSAMLDNAVEALVRSGRELRHVLMMLTPEAWEKMADLPPARRDFYSYHAALCEPWDGPAALVFTDGRVAGATLDRNGLRPIRYQRTREGLLVCGSETGVIPLPASQIIRRGKLGPGQMLLIDIQRGRMLLNDETKAEVCERQPYGAWVRSHLYHLQQLDQVIVRGNGLRGETAGDSAEPQYEEGYLFVNDAAAAEEEERIGLAPLQQLFGYTSESLAAVLKPMALAGKEPVGAMGDDTPLAVMSRLPRALAHYFKQRFAEVTNPPIDPLREHMVMSLTTLLGRRRSILEETPEHARLLRLDSPVLDRQTVGSLRRLRRPAEVPFDAGHDGLPFSLVELDLTFPVAAGVAGLEEALDRLCAGAVTALSNGHNLLLLSDRAAGPERAPAPSLLAVGAVHHHLIRRGLRMQGSLLVEAGDVTGVHRLATLIGYGANAVHPWLALDSVRDLAREGRLKGIDAAAAAEKHYLKALEAGLLKIMSKMGISTVDSYCGAQIFECIGLADAVVDRCFTGTPNRLGGVGFEKLANDTFYRHTLAYHTSTDKLEHWGFYKYRKAGEAHALSPEVIRSLQKAVRHAGALDGGFAQAYGLYKRYTEQLAAQPPVDLRALLAFKPGRGAIPVEEVEPVEAIMRRFSTAAMSMGALSEEAHGDLAMAMNRIGGRSNSGEGGEDAARLGSERNSRVKQVASGRFGVTPAYLASAHELQIKMAQGSKPGEGGHLPGHKVSEKIAAIRLTTPGVALISPPPHHDIYSIEDLAQLIYDLRQANPRAEISVKLVSEAGVGTVAAGVAKGRANSVLISGHSGGTGASPLSSIKHAGMPWELGLAETQQVLRANGLRDRIILRADGGLRRGWDVVVAAILGADEFSFGTLAMIAEGCIMARVCHNNTCPVGVATQDPKLRAKYAGAPDHVIALFTFIAQEVRELLAELGFRSLNEVIGRTELLEQRVTGDTALDSLNLSALLAQPDVPTPRHFQAAPDFAEPHSLGNRLAEAVVAAIALKELPFTREVEISNVDRSVGARLGGRLVQLGMEGLAAGQVAITFRGSAGQSFGAFLPQGVRFTLIGDANDYVGKGLAGGVLALRPPADAAFVWRESYIVGNTCLYGATGGVLYAAGRAGERFAVRNSRADAVIEGVGDHGCEYMTGGVVVVLGRTGHNFGAGMTGGQAFVLEVGSADAPEFPGRVNEELVYVTRVADAAARGLLYRMVSEHLQATDSPLAAELLANWEESLSRFWHVRPRQAPAAADEAEEGEEMEPAGLVER
ncbi:MAG: glutamate synthase large subunit [Caldilineales bacterium]|nr:glutamate synthase large subunit [Caldilineales bacterium]